jgi:hypothetical protein
MDLPDKESSFDFDHVADLTGKRYEGQFTVRCVLTIAQKHAMEIEKTRLLGNFTNPTDGLAGIAVILSTLRHKIVDAPEWWKQSGGGSSIEDEDVLVAIYDKIVLAEAEWREKLKKKASVQKKSSKSSQTTQEE